MKNLQNKLLVLLFIFLVLPQLGYSQDSSTMEFSFEVSKALPSISITQENLEEAHTLIDLNRHFKSSWIKEYISVEISTSYKGQKRKAVSKNNQLTQEQKDLMNRADLGKDIAVKVHYMPENTLAHNEPKEMNFTFIVDPEKDASYVGGQQELRQYLKESAIDKIVEGSFNGYDLTAITFAISETGEVVDARVFDNSFQSYKNEKVHQLLLDAICDMPAWVPAEYANGSKVKQEFVLSVGNPKSCMVNLLNIRRLAVE